MSVKQFILILILSIFGFTLVANEQRVRVILFEKENAKSFSLMPTLGKYEAFADAGTTFRIRKNDIIYLSQVGDSISVWDNDNHLGTFKRIVIDGQGRHNAFRLETGKSGMAPRNYEGNLEVEVLGRKLQIVNEVSLEEYIAGVVEAEAGPKAPFEFYKAQAIISRTYLMELILRQGGELYELKDNVNHQVYKGISEQNPEIKKAVLHTKGLVIVDSTLQLIIAAFHSNSGGQTANSEHVWLKSTSYLKGKGDPFSQNQRNSFWQDTIPADKWLAFFKSQGFNINSPKVKESLLNIQQKERMQYFVVDGDTLAFRKFREEFGLRSAWFDCYLEGNKVILKGRGYGHGVGLSQEGGMQMARENYNFVDIIAYYFKGVKVVPWEQCGIK